MPRKRSCLMLNLGGLSLLHLAAVWSPDAVVLLLVVVVLSYRQNLSRVSRRGVSLCGRAGRTWGAGPPSLPPVRCLSTTWLTSRGVRGRGGGLNIVSAVPSSRHPRRRGPGGRAGRTAGADQPAWVEGVLGRFFAIPTYGFVLSVFAMIALGMFQIVGSHAPVAESAAISVRAQGQVRGLLLVALVLRAFASGCTALTGVEAASNLVSLELQEASKSRSAGTWQTQPSWGSSRSSLFVGITRPGVGHRGPRWGRSVPAGRCPAGAAPKRLVIAQIAGAGFLDSSSIGFLRTSRLSPPPFWCWPANTAAFNGFPDPRLDPEAFRTGSCHGSSRGGATGLAAALSGVRRKPGRTRVVAPRHATRSLPLRRH